MINFFQKIQGMNHISDRVSFIVENCRGKDVLHVGCVDSGLLSERLDVENLLHKRLSQVAGQIVGLDIDAAGIEQMRTLGFKDIHVANIEENIPLQQQFDVIVAGEVVEHLNNPGLFLSQIARLLAPNGIFLITVPNAFNIFPTRFLFRNIEAVHPDHVFYFSPHTLTELLKRHELTTSALYGYTIDLPQNSLLNTLKKFIIQILIERKPQFSEGLIAISRKT